MKRLRFAALLALVALVALAPARGADAPPPGSYTLVDGPAAGLDLFAGKNGTVSILDRAADARVVAADDDCDQPHLHGTIDGQDEPVGGCGWGRVVSDLRRRHAGTALHGDEPHPSRAR